VLVLSPVCEDVKDQLQIQKNDEISKEAVAKLKSVDVFIKKGVWDAIRILLEVGTGSSRPNKEFIDIVVPRYIRINRASCKILQPTGVNGDFLLCPGILIDDQQA
jgi:hypothetical protein